MLLPPGRSTLSVVFHFLVADMPAPQQRQRIRLIVHTEPAHKAHFAHTASACAPTKDESPTHLPSLLIEEDGIISTLLSSHSSCLHT
jgi:hypothetical protein